MKSQPRLFAEPPAPPSTPAEPKPSVMSTRPAKYRRDFRAHDIANREAARIILSEPKRYAGLPLEWAQRVMERIG